MRDPSEERWAGCMHCENLKNWEEAMQIKILAGARTRVNFLCGTTALLASTALTPLLGSLAAELQRLGRADLDKPGRCRGNVCPRTCVWRELGLLQRSAQVFASGRTSGGLCAGP